MLNINRKGLGILIGVVEMSGAIIGSKSDVIVFIFKWILLLY